MAPGGPWGHVRAPSGGAAPAGPSEAHTAVPLVAARVRRRPCDQRAGTRGQAVWGSWSTWSSRGHPPPGAPSHAPAGTRPSQFVDAVGLVADDGARHPRPPAPYHHQHLARPGRPRLMTPPPPLTDLRAGGRDTPHRQSPRPSRPGRGDDPPQHAPPPPPGGPGALPARRQRIAVMPRRGAVVTPAPRPRLVADARAVTAHGDPWGHQAGQEAAPHLTGGPSCPAEHVVVQADVSGMVPAHLAAGGRHGPPTPGEARPDDPHRHLTPGGWRPRRRKLTSYCGDRC